MLQALILLKDFVEDLESWDRATGSITNACSFSGPKRKYRGEQGVVCQFKSSQIFHFSFFLPTSF